MQDEIRRIFDESRCTTRQAEEHLAGRVQQAVEIIIECYRSGGGLLIFGNGGSAADAQHIACELVGRFFRDRPGLRAQALTADPVVVTSIANDYGFEAIFARQVEACGRKGDVAIGLSTSGNSPNVVAALAAARGRGLKTIAMTGEGGGRCAALADVLLDVPCKCTPRVQEAHSVIYHIICQLVEAAAFEGANG